MITGNRANSQLRRLAFVLLMSILMTLLACSDPRKAYVANETMVDLFQGGLVELESFSGRWLLMNYWASWCKPCVKEIPELNRIDQHPDVQVLMYNFDRLSGEALRQEADKLGVAVPMMLNEPAQLFDLKSPSALPATLVVDRNSGEHVWLMGAQTEDILLQKLELASERAE